MVYNTQNYWVFGHFSVVRLKLENISFLEYCPREKVQTTVILSTFVFYIFYFCF
jgi:hypothetical protein